MKFRLNVHKMKCTNCDTIVLIEKANFSRLNFVCPSCVRRLEHMEDITVEETKGGNNLSQKQTNYIITVLDKEVYTLDLECKKLDDKIHSLQGELHRLKNEKENKREQITTLQSYIYSLGGNNK